MHECVGVQTYTKTVLFILRCDGCMVKVREIAKPERGYRIHNQSSSQPVWRWRERSLFEGEVLLSSILSWFRRIRANNSLQKEREREWERVEELIEVHDIQRVFGIRFPNYQSTRKNWLFTLDDFNFSLNQQHWLVGDDGLVNTCITWGESKCALHS